MTEGDAAWKARYEKRIAAGDTPEQAKAAADAGEDTSGKGASPAMEWRQKAMEKATALYGPGVAKHVMSALSPWLAAHGGDNKDQLVAAAPMLDAQFDQHLQGAINADTADRHQAFQKYFKANFTLPVVLGMGPTKAGDLAASNAAIAELEDQYEKEYEEYYQQHGAGGAWPNNDIAITNFLYAKAQSVMGKARPDQTPMEYQEAIGFIRQNLQAASGIARQLAARANAYTAAVRRAYTGLAELGKTIGDTEEDAAVRLKLSDAASLLDDPYLMDAFKADLSGMSADQYVQAVIGPGVHDALRSDPRYAQAVIDNGVGGVDMVGTVGQLKNLAAVEKTRATPAKEAAEWAAKANELVTQAERSQPGTAAKLGAVNPALALAAAGGNVAVAQSNLQSQIDIAAIGAKEEAGAAEAKVKAEHYGVMANQAFQRLTPDIQARMRERFGDDPAAMIFQLSGSDPAKAADTFEHEAKMAEAEVGRTAAYAGSFTADNFFDPSKFTPEQQAKFKSGAVLTRADALAIAQANHLFQNAYQPGVSPENAAAASKAVEDAYTASGGDPTKFTEKLNQGGAATPGGRGALTQLWAGRPGATGQDIAALTPQGGTQVKDLPRGGLMGRASLAFQYGLIRPGRFEGQTTPGDQFSPEQLAQRSGIEQQMKDLDAKDAEEANLRRSLREQGVAAIPGQPLRARLPRGRKA